MPELTLPLAASLFVTVAAAAVVLAAAVVGAALAVARGRRWDRPAPAGDALVGELRAIGAQMEQSLVEQRHQGETQRQLLAQKLEGVRETMDEQSHAVGGLRNEFRHEVRRRDAEMEQIRHQIETIRMGAAPARAALPPHEPASAGTSGDGAAPPAAALPEAAALPDDPPPIDRLDLSQLVPPAAPESAPPDAAGDGLPDPSDLDIFTPMSFAAPRPDGDAAWIARADRAGGADVDGPRPEGAEDLTVIGSVDARTQAALYKAGILTLDDVARIGPGAAQRLSEAASVSEDMILNQWVFEAQAVLFDRFSPTTRA
ncbi:hypothetical protein RQM47_12495 [Rubrivirga sp. S365]|uniref:Uncharacterized protein n=1 Tax=Rubrivirga litoralis TaxID=3075598 RepID=A0ABU3BUT8_9BACT|nr:MULTISPECIES: hypothetical protein [unclassified Rubrivirga]MDT0632916.1 hypothetical protein [Rubrivirga sp. F394]MDT7857464.1 hypothetical protein [Rubrivirga sp. S365]